jgi:hypothetical protein
VSASEAQQDLYKRKRKVSAPEAGKKIGAGAASLFQKRNKIGASVSVRCLLSKQKKDRCRQSESALVLSS